MRYIKPKKASKKAFTLVEMVVVVAVIAVLSAIAVPAVSGTISRANRSADDSSAKSIEDAIKYGMELNVVGSGRQIADVGEALDISGLENTILTARQKGYAFYYQNSTGAVTANNADPDGAGADYILLTPDMPFMNNSGLWFLGQAVPATGVSLDRTSMIISLSDPAVKLTATIIPSNTTQKTLIWTSNNTAVATVNANGYVTPVAPGSARITVTVKGTAISASCDVRVIIPATGVSLDNTTLTMIMGEPAHRLTATLAPANTTQTELVWSSSNTAVATVDANGNVTPVAPGSAQITVRVVENNALSATCSVTVHMAPATGISIPDNVYLRVGANATITPTITPSGAGEYTLSWSSSNESRVTVSNGAITAKATGTATIKVTLTNWNGTIISTACNVTVYQASISLDKKNIKVDEDNGASNHTDTLTATFEPGGTVSADGSRYTDRYGVVYSIGISSDDPDTATITFKQSSGNTAQYTITGKNNGFWFFEANTTVRVSLYINSTQIDSKSCEVTVTD